jgi:hypothetical protein
MQKFKLTKFIFLIGGMDLEMATIIGILDLHGLQYVNKKLSWGATLSAYEAYFNDENTFVGIELTEDIKPPKHYVCIDHHNEKSHKPSSLQQIAVLLELTLNRDQLLICANDAGYIPAMEAMGASKEEIAAIRMEDRKQQGVTEEDERLAEVSIRENMIIQDELIVIKSLTSRFSAITDRLYPYRNLLIYTDDSLTYYGAHIKELVRSFSHLIKEGKAYNGGGDDGFFGISMKSLSPDTFIQLKDKLILSISKLKQ